MTNEIQISQNIVPARGLVLESAEDSRSRDLLSVIRAAVARVDFASASDDLDSLDLDEFDFVVLIHDQAAPQKCKSLVQHFDRHVRRNRLLLYCAGTTEEDLAEFLWDFRLGNLFAYEDGLHADELYTTVQKMVKQDLFGPEKYFSWEAQTETYQLRSTEKLRTASEFAREFSAEVGLPGRICDNFSLVTEELLSNALYNAPVDENRAPRFEEVSRSRDVTLDEGEDVEFTLIRDGERVGISVCDPFGSLAANDVLDYLGSCCRDSTGQISWSNQGAGLGLYQSFQRLSHLVVNLDPGSRTEIIGLVSLHDRYADFVSEGRAFNLFVRNSSPF